MIKITYREYFVSYHLWILTQKTQNNILVKRLQHHIKKTSWLRRVYEEMQGWFNIRKSININDYSNTLIVLKSLWKRLTLIPDKNSQNKYG